MRFFSGIWILIVMTAPLTGTSQLIRFRFSADKMGSPFHLIFFAKDSVTAYTVAEKAFALVDRLNHIYSDYDSSSELSRVNREAAQHPVYVSDSLFQLFQQSQLASEESSGAFDITVGPLSLLWRRSRKGNLFPDSATVHDTKQKTGFAQLQLDPVHHTVFFRKPGMRIDLGGIAKGAVAEMVIRFLREQGIQYALADAGGDMVMSDAPPGTQGWTVGVNVPGNAEELLHKRLLLANSAVATSGDAFQYIEHTGVIYSHIIDPRTGYGVPTRRNVTIIARDGALADWLATTCSILPIRDAKALAKKMKAELLITVSNKTEILYYKTSGFDRYWKPDTKSFSEKK
jgi:thiamine biosynthesis lipoprotein